MIMKKLLLLIALILFISFSKSDSISLAEDDLSQIQKTERTSFVVKGNCKMCKNVGPVGFTRVKGPHRPGR